MFWRIIIYEICGIIYVIYLRGPADQVNSMYWEKGLFSTFISESMYHQSYTVYAYIGHSISFRKHFLCIIHDSFVTHMIFIIITEH